jgi:hypothetical protein
MGAIPLKPLKAFIQPDETLDSETRVSDLEEFDEKRISGRSPDPAFFLTALQPQFEPD